MATRAAEDEDGEKIIFPDCPGVKGPLFTRWKERVLDIGCGRGDEDASWSATLEGTDPAGGRTMSIPYPWSIAVHRHLDRRRPARCAAGYVLVFQRRLREA